MNTSRKGFLSSMSLAAAFAGCSTTKGIQPTRFKPFEVPGLKPRPDFWKVRPAEIIELCESATKCSRKEVICHTPLGYPVYALFYGDFNEPPPQTNWSAGKGSTTYRNYYGRQQGGVQTFLFIAGVHGAEPETVAGAMNLIKMLETGTDFRGRKDQKFLDLVGKYRFIVVPCVNMDGRAISPDHLHEVDWVTFRKVSQGTWKDGSLVGWRGSKAWFPLPLDKVSYPGGYPNADGYNIMHDAAPGDLRTEEAKALLKLAARWRVDAVLNGHSYEWEPSVLMPGAIDYPEKLERTCEVRYRCNLAMHKAGLIKVEPKPPSEDTRRPAGAGFNINTLFALASGALTLTLECSVSYDKNKPNISPTRTYTFDELLEVTYVTVKAILECGLEKPFVNRGPETVYKD